MITGKTKYYAILGDPIDQALSPIVHNPAFQAAGIDAVFLGCRVVPGEVKAALDGARALHFSGLAVTMPLKREVIPYLDECEEKIDFLGAVNVITCENGRMKGYNTDGDGFVRNAREHGVEPAGRDVVMFGAGGAARGLAYALLAAGIRSLTIVNIDEPMAREMMEPLQKRFPQAGFDFVLLGDSRIAEVCRKSTFIVNATSLGMKNSPSPHVDMIPWKELSPDTVCGDVIHTPTDTAFIRAARAQGLQTLTGDGMLLYQGVEAFRLYTGLEPSVEVMQQALLHKNGA